MVCFCDWALSWGELKECRAVLATKRKKSDFPLPYACPSDTLIFAPKLDDKPSRCCRPAHAGLIRR